jgi:hypothetical protein
VIYETVSIKNYFFNPAALAFSAIALPTAVATSVLVPLASTPFSLEEAATNVLPSLSSIN